MAVAAPETSTSDSLNYKTVTEHIHYTVYVISSESFWFGLEKCLIEVVFQGA